MGERGSLGILETIVTDVLEPWIQPSAIRMMTDTGASLSRAPLMNILAISMSSAVSVIQSFKMETV
jgi:hypothetical protein